MGATSGPYASPGPTNGPYAGGLPHHHEEMTMSRTWDGSPETEKDSSLGGRVL